MCFSLAWIESILIWLVILCAVVALLKLVVPWVLGILGVDGGIILQAINIIVWAIVAIAIIIFIFGLISCLIGMGGGVLTLPHH